MTSLKSQLFTPELQQRAKLFKALGHPARLAILEYLAEIKSCMTGNIADELPLSRTTVNQHLKELRDANLIKGTVEGVKKNYCLSSEGVDLLSKEIRKFLNDLESTGTFC
jgi:ArsR family transcriptional regulator, arsenate/arsenite/antimonite-responsive transcriptional repressor